jgi:hypothetical protein
MTLFQYTAYANPQGATEFLQNVGIAPAPNPQGLAQQLAHCAKANPKRFFKEIIPYHPDAPLFIKEMNEAAGIIKEQYSNANGQEIKQEVEKINESLKKQAQPILDKDKSKDILTLGLIAIIALAIIYKK